MTVIVFDGRTIASDSISTGEWRDLGHDKPKFRVLAKGVLSATAGQCIWGGRFDAWAKTGRGKYPLADSDAIGEAVVLRNGKWARYVSGTAYPERVGNTWAIGSGAPYAIAALALGHDAIAAAWVAMQLDPHCGGSIWAIDVADIGKRGAEITKREYRTHGR